MCGERNPPQARFCLACGAPLEASGGVAGEERRLVTVLFAELAGHRSGGAIDPEELKRGLDRFYGWVRQEVASFGGTVDKLMGSTVLAVFGAPVAHEDDPERALRAGVNIRDRATEYAEADPGSELAVRVGVNTGEAVVARPGSGPQIGEAVTGDVVNTAARLQTAAAPGSVIVGEATYRAAEHAFVFEALQPVTVKGKADALAIWRVVEARSRFGVDLRPRPGTPFVGRREEREMLQGAFRRSATEPSVQLVTITGEAGVGKTRLVQELEAFADEYPSLIRWRQGRCLPYGEGIGFWALGEIVKAEAGILESDGPNEGKAKLRAAIERSAIDPGERDWLRERVAPLVGVGVVAGDAPREELFEAWRRFLEALAARNPTVLVFEDVQWADEGMLAFVEYLVDWTVGLPLLVVCTARPEIYERYPAWGGGRRNATSISLAPLTDLETSMLLSALLERSVLATETQAVLLERCGGNPLYAEEFARMLRDRGLIDDTRGGLVAEVPMPQTLQLLIGARLDTLPLRERTLLQDAAVVGKVFWAEAVASVSGVPERDVVASLHESVQREFVRPVRASSMGGQAEYAFLHMLVQEVAYGHIPRAARAAKHVAVARWIREVAGERVSDLAEVLAHHYLEALSLARAAPSELDVSQIEEMAGVALMMAGKRAKRLDAARAHAFFARARDVLPEGDPERTRALLECAEAAEDLGRFDEASQRFELAIEEFRAAGDDLGLGEAMARFARTVLRQGPAARAMLEDAISLLERQEPGPELARAATRMAGQLYVAGDNAGAVTWAERAIALADEIGLEDEAVLALQYRGAARAQMGDPRGVEDLRQALRRALDLGLGNETAVTYNNLALQLWSWEGPEAAKVVWDEMIEFCRARGFRTLAIWAESGALESLFDLGEWDRVLATCEEMLAWDREHGPTRVAATALTHVAWVHLRRGDLERAGAVAAELLPRARGIGYGEFLGPALVISAELAMVSGRFDEVIELAREFASTTEDELDYRALFLPLVTRQLVAAGEVGLAEELVASLPRHPSARRVALSVLTSEAVVAEARGDVEGALLRYREAALGWGEYRFSLECGRSTIGAGRCLLALGRDAEAVQALTEAKRLLRALGARLFVAEADALLVRAVAASH